MMVLENIEHLHLFDGITSDDLDHLMTIFSLQSFDQDEMIFEQNARAEFFYILANGKVAIHYKPYDGPPLIIAHIQPGNVFGWSAMLQRDVYTSAAVAAEDSLAYRVRGSDLLSMCSHCPDSGAIILQRIAKAISRRLQGTHSEILKIFRSGMDLSNECWKRMIEDE